MFVCYPISFATEGLYIWSKDYDDIVSTSSTDDSSVDSNNSLALESGSAILIEQEFRSNSI